MKLISTLTIIFSIFSSLALHAKEAKFYKIDGLREDGRACSVEISFGNNQHGYTPFVAFYGEVLAYVPLEIYQIEELYEVNNGQKEISFEGEHVWTFNKVKLYFDNQKRPIKATAKVRPTLSPFSDKDECYLKSSRIDF